MLVFLDTWWTRFSPVVTRHARPATHLCTPPRAPRPQTPSPPPPCPRPCPRCARARAPRSSSCSSSRRRRSRARRRPSPPTGRAAAGRGSPGTLLATAATRPGVSTARTLAAEQGVLTVLGAFHVQRGVREHELGGRAAVLAGHGQLLDLRRGVYGHRHGRFVLLHGGRGPWAGRGRRGVGPVTGRVQFARRPLRRAATSYEHDQTLDQGSVPEISRADEPRFHEVLHLCDMRCALRSYSHTKLLRGHTRTVIMLQH